MLSPFSFLHTENNGSIFGEQQGYIDEFIGKKIDRKLLFKQLIIYSLLIILKNITFKPYIESMVLYLKSKKKKVIIQKSTEVNILEFSEVCKYYNILSLKKNTKILENTNFVLKKGQKVAFLGQNGCGKTTICKLISNEEVASDGTILIDNYYAKANSPNRSNYIPQELYIDPKNTPFTLIKTIALLNGYSFLDASKIAELLISELELDSYTNTHYHKLSGGTKRKVILATVLLSEKKVLLLDEPTTGIDLISKEIIWNFLKNIKKDTTLGLVSHCADEVDNFVDDVFVVGKGQIIIKSDLFSFKRNFGGNFIISLGFCDDLNEREESIVCKKIEDKFKIIEKYVSSKSLILKVEKNNKEFYEAISFVCEIENQLSYVETVFVELEDVLSVVKQVSC